MKTTQLFIGAILIMAISACSSGTKKTDHSNADEQVVEHKESVEHKAQSENAHWSYEGEDGPEKWKDLCPAYATCSGERQSPIDLSSNIDLSSTLKIERTFNCVSNIEFINNGHSIQVNVTDEKVNTLNVNNELFKLKQFHFHCPSEHTLDGVAFDAEMHLVNVSDAGNISVIGVFIKEGKENVMLNKLLKVLPANAGDKNVITDEVCPAGEFSPDDEYYIYEGSLTTPPCTEGVNWFVRTKHIEASVEQIEALKKVMPANNARPVQPINDREFGELDE